VNPPSLISGNGFLSTESVGRTREYPGCDSHT
jgi:hypothetical protein